MNDLFLPRAKENLAAAEQLFASELYNASANRAYYAAFHAAIAAVFAHGFRVETDHAKVQATFNGRLINQRKVFHSRLKSLLPDMQNIRDEADYRRGVGKRTAAEQLKMSKEFVSAIVKEIEP